MMGDGTPIYFMTRSTVLLKSQVVSTLPLLSETPSATWPVITLLPEWSAAVQTIKEKTLDEIHPLARVRATSFSPI